MLLELLEGEKQLTSQSEVNISYYKPALQMYPSYLPFGGRKDTFSHGSFFSNYNLLSLVILFDKNLSKVFKTRLVELVHLPEIWNKGREFSPGAFREKRSVGTRSPAFFLETASCPHRTHTQLPRDFLKMHCCYINIKSRQWVSTYILKKSLRTLK